MFKKKLACSFCGRGADAVEKLVAGPRVYICDRCVAEAVRIMNEATPPDASAPGASPGGGASDDVTRAG